jgi:hypothetical protein
VLVLNAVMQKETRASTLVVFLRLRSKRRVNVLTNVERRMKTPCYAEKKPKGADGTRTFEVSFFVAHARHMSRGVLKKRVRRSEGPKVHKE